MENDFERKIKQHVERLKQQTYQALESETARKRISWCKQNFPQIDPQKPPAPRTAYECFFFNYLGIPETEVPVISENDSEIVWSSRNKCPTLAACQILGLDTREVCRAVYEKSTQVFVSQLDPQLRFYRSYREIRPYSFHCRERIIRINFEQIMQLALEEARFSKIEGNKGYGAVVAFGKEIIGKAHDTAANQDDPSLHAPANALRQAVKTSGDRNLCGAILFSTCEPCPRCTTLTVRTNVTTIVYGVSAEEIVRSGPPQIRIPSQEIIDKSSGVIEVIRNVLKEECHTLLS